MKKLLIEIAIVIVLLAGLFILYQMWQHERNNRIRLEDNQQVLLKDNDYFKWKDEQNTAKIGTLNLTLKELKDATNEQMMDLKKEVERLDIKLKNVQQLTTANLKTTSEIIGIFTDTTEFIYGDTVSVKRLRMKTEFNDVQLTYYPLNDSLRGRVITYDKMTQVIFKEPRGFKFWQREWWQPREISQVITFKNPDTKIEYPVTVKIVKRGKKIK